MNLVIDPPLAVITLADVPPYNNYTLYCNANLPLEFQFFNINLSWFDMETGQQVLPNDSIVIQNISGTSGLAGETITTYTSMLAVWESRNGSYTRVCRADVSFQDLVDGEQVTRAYSGIATSRRTISVRGEFIVCSWS